ncbi:MAG: ATP-dependent Clp protease ATP-binding subunit [Flavobacteriales bacterium]|nr:ATP-dependent Clp protease ATP-binding subunit [Flavobacteriales bacterium]
MYNLIAPRKAQELAHANVEPSHLLWAMLHDTSGLSGTLSSAGIDLLYARDWAETRMEGAAKSKGTPTEPEPSVAADDVLKEARRLAARFPKSSATSENAALLAALCRPGLAFSKDQLQTFPLTEKMVLELFGTAVEENGKAANGSAKPGKTGSVLATYCTDKTAQAEAGKLDPILGRDKEVRQMVEILGRRTTPNVVLLGEPGVGKSALVEGFALNIAQGNVPERLKGARVFELDIGALVAGASYKGETEDRLKKIIKEVQQYPNAILFIDEVHVLMDPQGSAGKGLADILKPELARGGLTVVAATTNEEYRKYMEKDDAFARRFGVVRIEEPDADLASRMLEAILPNYEKHHKLGIENAAIIGAVELAKRYVKDRCLPASAVGLMDQTMSAVRLLMDTSGSELEKLEKELEALMSASQQGSVELAKELDWFELRMGRSLSPILLAMLEEGKKEEAADTPRAEILKDRIAGLKAASNEKREKVHYADVVSIVAHNTGIPIGRLQSGERERLLNMAEMLGQRVMGQDHALSTVTESMIDARSGLARDGKPKGAFFFLGPTGTGKTELTKAIAEQLFNDESALLRFDMSEFKEERDVQKLIGTSPGLVGYEEGGQLVNSIRRQPYSVVLFDEIEKAHPKIFDIFLQILGEGFVTDNKGNKGDFSNALIVFTSNIGAQAIAAIFKEGRVPTTDELSAILGKSEGFRPELIGRFVANVDIIPFAPISREAVGKIFDHHLRKEITHGLQKMGITLEITSEARERLLEEGYSELYGARPILGVIRNRLRKPVSRALVTGGNDSRRLRVVLNDSTDTIHVESNI